MTDATAHADPENLTVAVSRHTRVTPRQIWSSWVEADVIAGWWGPAGFTSTVNVLDVREGGRFDVVMHGPDGTDYANVYVFDEVVAEQRLSYTNQGSREFGLGPFVSVMEIRQEARRDGGDSDDPPVTRLTLAATYASESDFRRHLDQFNALEGAEQLIERLERAAAEQPVIS